MITEIVTFKLPAGMTREKVQANFEKTAPVWGQNPDLLVKYYLYDEEKGVAGGVYLWREKADADKWHGEDFRKKVKDLYGAVPESVFYETPIVIDNLADGEGGGDEDSDDQD